jgi:hypothetical protein
MSGTAANGYGYRQAFALHVNPGGAPNCVWRMHTAYGAKIPVLCSPYYGLLEDEQPPASENMETSKACKWTVSGMLAYLRFLVMNPSPDAVELYSLHDLLDWPDNLQSGVEDRILAEDSYEGMNILGALEKVLDQSGHFALYMCPLTASNNEAQNTLSIVQTLYDGNGIVLQRPSGDATTGMDVPLVVTQGSLKASGKNLYTRFWISGAPIFIERRVASDLDKSYIDHQTGSLLAAWGQADQDALIAFLTTRLGAGDTLPAAIEKGFRKYPSVFMAYRVNPAYNFQAGSSEEGKARADVARPVLPTTLTSYLEASAAATVSGKQRFRRPILVEYKVGTVWYLADWSDGIEVLADGTILLPGLREMGFTHRVWAVGTTAVLGEVRNLRMTLAIPCDHRLNRHAVISSDSDAANANYFPIDADDDAGNDGDIDPRLRRMYAAVARDSYRHDIRRDGWPEPEVAVGSNPHADGDIQCDCTDVMAHLLARLREHGRVNISGSLVIPRMTMNFAPGLQVGYLGSYPIRGVVRRISIVSNADPGGGNDLAQFTELILD